MVMRADRPDMIIAVGRDVNQQTKNLSSLINGSQREKHVFGGFRPCKTQTDQLSYLVIETSYNFEILRAAGLSLYFLESELQRR